MTEHVEFAEATCFARWLAPASAEDKRPALPVDSIRRLSVDHCVTGRVVQRLLDDKNPSGPLKALLADLLGTHAEVMKQYIRVTDVIEDLSCRMGLDGIELIVVNGFSTYHITRNPFHLRPCEPNKILTPGEPVIADLRAVASSTEEVLSTSNSERSFLFRGVRFDRYSAFPLGPLDTHRPLNKSPSRALAPSSTKRQIDFDDLIFHCDNLYSDGSINVFTPRAHAAVFLKVADFYHDLVKENASMPVDKMRFRLHSLIEIADLLAAPVFDVEDFNVLCKRFGTQHQNLETGRLIYLLLGIKTILLADSSAGHADAQ